jgi:hypothetical protein
VSDEYNIRVSGLAFFITSCCSWVDSYRAYFMGIFIRNNNDRLRSKANENS